MKLTIVLTSILLASAQAFAPQQHQHNNIRHNQIVVQTDATVAIPPLTETPNEVTPDTNANGVPFGETDLKIKCPFHRLHNPNTNSYKKFQADMAKHGMPPLLTDVIAWPMIVVQKGFLRALLGEALDTTELDGIVSGFVSHKDLMWPHRTELNAVIKEKQDTNGTIHINDIYDIKAATAEIEGFNSMTKPSFLEIPLIFILCGGDMVTARVSAAPVVRLLSGELPFGQEDSGTKPPIELSLKKIRQARSLITRPEVSFFPGLYTFLKSGLQLVVFVGFALFQFVKCSIVAKVTGQPL